MTSINNHDLDILLNGVSEVDVPGTVGILSVFGSKAFPIIAGKLPQDDTKNTVVFDADFSLDNNATINQSRKSILRHALAAGSRLGDGRLVIFAHTGYLCPTSPELGKLITNSIRWSAGEGKANIKVAIYPDSEELSAYCQDSAQNMTVKVISEEEVKNLDAFDVLVLDNVTDIESSSPQIESIKKFVKAGGGFITTGTGWAYEGDIKLQHPGNQITHEAGLRWTSHYETVPIEDGATNFSTDRKHLRLINCTEAWNQIMAHVILPVEDLEQISAVISEAVSSLPDQDPFLQNIRRNFGKAFQYTEYPSEANPVENPIVKTIVALRVQLFISEQTVPAPEAYKLFPGLVDRAVERKKDYDVTLDINSEGWYSTGVYAPPYEQITVKFLPNGITAKSEFLYLQIGCHSDDITNQDKWNRCPIIVSTKKINATDSTITAVNAFGGLIYINHTGSADVGRMTLKISGGVLAPYFKLGTTANGEWKNKIRYYKTPFGELQGKRIILTFPTDRLLKVENPEELMTYWDTVMDYFADFVGIPVEREKPFRIVGDLQIGGGYMHSGYPIMMHLDDSIDIALSLARLKSKEGWGHYHEIGHNHQENWWTFEEVVEVTNNLMVLYIFETLVGISIAEARPDKFTPENRRKQIMKYAKSKKNYKKYWPDNPFLALLMYYQLKEMFGWDAYKKVFRDYRTKPEDEQPEDDDEKVDAWMVTFSRIVGQNLAPLFESWKVTISDAARKEVENLPKTDQRILSAVKSGCCKNCSLS